ncbi:hypothetical protein AB1Y20_005746 [Prymnesium parvum]|uniref:SPX domain-containing protein n=1 Tax=Prymnesium parvum TaxID=97485 RepID=A0AB34J0G9_PRYPA
MVKFGRQIEELQRPEWANGYMDYAALKATLKSMIKSGHCQVFDENSVYAPISVATSEETLTPTGPHEIDFMTQVDREIEKVNKFASQLHEQLDQKVKEVKAMHNEWTAGGCDPSKVMALREEVEACSSLVQGCEDYINLNYIAFSKILKKHDKVSTCPFRMPYLMRIQNQTFVHHRMVDIIKSISDMHASLHGDAVKSGAQAFDPNQKGGTSFVRRTIKYWVKTKDVLKVKMFLLKHLPIYKFTDGLTDGDLVSSVYFDNAKRELYEGRLKKYDGAVALRIRWYGKEDAINEVYVERKTHREDWYGDGEASAKERFPLLAADVVPFLQGKFTPDQYKQYLEASKFKGDVQYAVNLATEVQNLVRKAKLRPSLRTHYMRTAFQRTGDATVRCSLDTELCMALEPCGTNEWKRSKPLTSRDQVTQFPHAVLEVKLQLVSGTQQPEWVSELIASGYLKEMPKFSKFVHGTAYLNRADILELPYWWAPEWVSQWADIALSRPLPVRILDHEHLVDDNHDEAPNWGRLEGDMVVSVGSRLQELFRRIVSCDWNARDTVVVTPRAGITAMSPAMRVLRAN